MSTEARNPRSYGLDKMSARQIVRLMNEDEYAVLNALQANEEGIAKAAERAAEAYRHGGRIIYVGAGTSGRIAVADTAEMPPTFGVEPDRFIAVVAGGNNAKYQAHEDAEDDEHAPIVVLNELGLNREDVLFGLAAGGKTPFVVSAVRHAKQKGVWTCAITNSKTPILEVADLGLFLDTGPEILTGSTRLKAGTAQKLVLNRISTVAMVLNGKVIENLMVDVKANNMKLKERCARIVRELTMIPEQEAWELLEQHNWNVREVVQVLKDKASVA